MHCHHLFEISNLTEPLKLIAEPYKKSPFTSVSLFLRVKKETSQYLQTLNLKI